MAHQDRQRGDEPRYVPAPDVCLRSNYGLPLHRRGARFQPRLVYDTQMLSADVAMAAAPASFDYLVGAGGDRYSRTLARSWRGLKGLLMKASQPAARALSTSLLEA